MRKIFAQISLNLPEKNSKENDLHKKRLHFFSCWVHLFKSKHNSSTIVELAQISPNLPEKNKIKTWPPKEKKVCTLILGAIFVKSKHIQRFCERFYKFCQKFHRCFPDFRQIKNFGGAVAPPSPTSVTLAEPHYMFCGTPVEKR